jgi:hypothetical protein
MRFVRGLRPDLLVVPFARWRGDTAFRARAARELRLGQRGAGDGWLAALVERRPACASMAFASPPAGRLAVRWTSRTLVWVAEPHSAEDRVPPGDFDFAAFKLALDTRDPWAQEALALYVRAARSNRSLCDAFATFKVSSAIPSCRR